MEAHELDFLLRAAPKSKSACAAIDAECRRLTYVAMLGLSEQLERGEQHERIVDQANKRYFVNAMREAKATVRAGRRRPVRPSRRAST